MPPSMQDFSDGQTRKEVPARTAGGYGKALHTDREPRLKFREGAMGSGA
jgi:hypothetical protein